jgi:hypothetical protein
VPSSPSLLTRYTVFQIFQTAPSPSSPWHASTKFIFPTHSYFSWPPSSASRCALERPRYQVSAFGTRIVLVTHCPNLSCTFFLSSSTYLPEVHCCLQPAQNESQGYAHLQCRRRATIDVKLWSSLALPRLSTTCSRTE